jgi:hypothetical protein
MVGMRNVFWQALIFTVLVFVAGMALGYYLESSRSNSVELNLIGAEIDLLDQQLRSKIVEDYNLSCSLAVPSTFVFADKVYEQAQQLERYDSANKFNRDTLNLLHKRYDLLRTMLWFEAIKTKQNCGSFHTVIYLFEYDPQDVQIRAQQAYYSRLLVDLKEKYGSKILLIPIASNLDLTSIELARQNYGANKIPAIIINEKRVIDEVITAQDLENAVFSND